MSAIELKNLLTGEVFYDTLHVQNQCPVKVNRKKVFQIQDWHKFFAFFFQKIQCSSNVCAGSRMGMFGTADQRKDVIKDENYVKSEACRFLRLFYEENRRSDNQFSGLSMVLEFKRPKRKALHKSRPKIGFYYFYGFRF